MNRFPSPKELAEEARRALEANPMNSDELFEFLVARGIIDRDGRVLVGKLFGEPDGEQTDAAGPTPSANGAAVEAARQETGKEP